MPASYTCPNPDCGVTLRTPNPVAVGKRVACPKCKQPFVPEPGDAAPAAPPPPPPPPPPAPESKSPFADDEEDQASINKGYGVVKETEAEIEAGKKNKPAFGAVKDKFKKSARGPAMELLVTPSNLLLGEGLLTGVGGLF